MVVVMPVMIVPMIVVFMTVMPVIVIMVMSSPAAEATIINLT